MAASPEMRASDRDRDRVAAALREHYAQGRLDADEFNERLETAYKAKTFGDLEVLTADLPDTDLHQLPVPTTHLARPIHGVMGDAKRHKGLRAAWAAWASVSAVNVVIWLIVSVTTTTFIYPWWVWVAGPWGAVLLVTTLFGVDRGNDRRR